MTDIKYIAPDVKYCIMMEMECGDFKKLEEFELESSARASLNIYRMRNETSTFVLALSETKFNIIK